LTRLGRGATGDAFECRVVRRGQGLRDVSVVVAPDLRDGFGHGRYGIELRWQLADVTDRKRVEADRDDLLHRLVTAQEDERRRVARELHDSFGQLLTGLSLGVRAVRDTPHLPPEAAERIAAVERIAGELHRAAHDLAVQLRPTALDDVGLPAALANLTAEWSRRTGVPVSFADSGCGDERFPPQVETALYRVVQEALTNVARHACPNYVGVMVGRRDDHAVAVVEDDGRGFNPEGPRAPDRPGGLGLAGMRERVTLLGGTVEIESAPGHGTTIFARIPLSEARSG
jgi:signal transduction histidine kinase